MTTSWAVRRSSLEEIAPTNWSIARVGDLVHLVNGFPFASSDFGHSGTMPLVRIRDLFTDEFETYVTGAVPRNAMIRDGDVVIGMDGDFNLAVWRRGEAALNQRLCALRPRGDVDIRFVAYALSDALRVINDLAYSTTVKHLSSLEVTGERLLLPPIKEQRRIADFLDAETARIDQMLRLQALLVTRLEERDQALRDGLVDQAASEHGEIPLRRFITHIEQGVSPQCDNSPRVADAWAVLKLSSVKRGNFIPDENKALPQHEIPSRAFEVRDGDFLVTRANTPSLVGDVAVVSGSPRRLLLPDLIYRVGLTTAVDPSFIMHVALASRTRLRIEAAARGSSQSMVKLRGDDIREWPVPAINLEYQRQLTASIEAASRASMALYAAIKTKQQLLAERRQALITAAVTGQIDVTTARGADLS